MGDYGNFLMRRFIVPYLKKGSQEVHLLFDDPGRQSENPKQFEHLAEIPPSVNTSASYSLMMQKFLQSGNQQLSAEHAKGD